MASRSIKNLCLLAGLGLTSAVFAAAPQTVSPRVLREPLWNFPVTAEGHGEARAILSIDATGKLVDFLVVGASHPVFAAELARALPEYRFTPALVQGEPKAARLPLTFQFERSGTMASVMPEEQFNALLKHGTQRPDAFSFFCPVAELDRPLTPVQTVSPDYPAELRAQRIPGEVKIEFIVDAQGRVRLPAIDAGVHPSFAREAIAALQRWRFEPPTRRGQPILVQAAQVFRFRAPDASPAAPEPRG